MGWSSAGYIPSITQSPDHMCWAAPSLLLSAFLSMKDIQLTMNEGNAF